MKKQSLLERVASKQSINANSVALKSLSQYEMTKKILDETHAILGNGSPTFKTNTASTLTTLKVNCHAQAPTTRKIYN